MNLFEILGNTYMVLLPFVVGIAVGTVLLHVFVPVFRAAYSYVADKKVDVTYLIGPISHLFPECIYGKDSVDDVTSLILASLINIFIYLLCVFIYPLILIGLMIYGILRLLRFVFRTRKYLDSHKHEDGKCKYKEIK